MDREVVFDKLRDYFKGKAIERLYVFGSFAAGTETSRSDLDLLVIEKSDKRFVERLKEYLDVDGALGLTVDLLIYTPEEWENVGKRKFFAKQNLLRIL